MNDIHVLEKNRQGIQSVEVGIRLLQVLADNRRAMKLRDLAAGADMPPSKAHRYLVSFIRAGFVEQNAETGLYDLGPYALQFSLSCFNRLDPVRLASSTLAELVAEIDESVMLAVWGSHGPTIVRWEESRRPVTVNVRIGSLMPLLLSATGRVFAAYLPRTRTRALIESELEKLLGSDKAPYLQSRDDVQRLLDEVRARGLSRVTGDLLPGVHAFGAPVFDYQGKLVLVLTVLGQAGTFDSDWDGPVAKALKRAAAELSRRLGYEG